MQHWAAGNSLLRVALCRGRLADQAPLPDCLLLIADNPPGIRTRGQRQKPGKVGKGLKSLPGDASEGVSEML